MWFYCVIVQKKFTYMSISRQNSERLGGGGSSGKLSSLRGGSGVFVHRKCCSASSLPHITGGWRRKNICEPYGNPWSLHSTARLASLVDVFLLFIPFCAFPLLPPPTPPRSRVLTYVSRWPWVISLFLSFFLFFLQIGTYYGSAVLAVDLNNDR